MDNFQIDVTAEGKSSLISAISLAFSHNAPGGKAESFEVKTLEKTEYSGLPAFVIGTKAFVLRWSKRDIADRPSIIDFPFRMDAEGAADFVARWLEEQDFGRQPDHDGDNEKGWRVYTGAWGHFDGDRRAICAISPVWAMYGK